MITTGYQRLEGTVIGSFFAYCVYQLLGCHGDSCFDLKIILSGEYLCVLIYEGVCTLLYHLIKKIPYFKVVLYYCYSTSTLAGSMCIFQRQLFTWICSDCCWIYSYAVIYRTSSGQRH